MGSFTYLNRKNKRKQIYVIFGIAVFAIVMIVAIIVLATGGKKNVIDTNQTTQYMTQAENVYNKSADIIAKLSDGSAVLDFKNEITNKDYIKYTIKLADTKEVLYESKLLSPGEKIGEVKLNIPKSLKAGTYDIKVYIENFTSPTDKESSQAVIQKLKLSLT